MLDAGCTTEILRVPQLKGLIRTDDRQGGQGIVGILIDHIDTERYELTFHLAPAPLTASPGGDAMGINCIRDGEKDTSHSYETPIPEIASSRREKWLSQIQYIVHKLHDLDIVWGDAKTANILLDRNDDLWVIDFGGGATPGWIDKKLINTKEGDLQALKRILEEIGGKRQVWRSDIRPPTDPEMT